MGLLKMPVPLNVGEKRVYTAEIKWASSRMAVKGGAKVGRAGVRVAGSAGRDSSPRAEAHSPNLRQAPA